MYPRMVNISAAREQLGVFASGMERVLIMQNGAPAAVLVPYDDFQALVALQRLASDRGALASALDALEIVREGRLHELQGYDLTSPEGRSAIRRHRKDSQRLIEEVSRAKREAAPHERKSRG